MGGAVPCLVAYESRGEFIDECSIERSVGENNVVSVSASNSDREWKTIAVCDCHDLGRLASTAFSDVWAPLFAGTYVPSMKPSTSSIPPRFLRSRLSATTTFSKAPASHHCWNRRWQVWYGGYRAGKSCHGAPVRNTHKMPSMTSLAGRGGRPRRPSPAFVWGRRGATKSHCASVSFISTVDHSSTEMSITSRYGSNFAHLAVPHF